MVSRIKTGRYSPKKAIKKATSTSFTQVPEDSQITWLEKGGQAGGATTKELIEDALDEYSRLFKAGIASNAEKLTLARAFPDAPSYVAAAADIPESSVMVVGGPASVEMIDREGHLIKADALDRAFKKYMENFRTRNAMVLHSDVQVGWALPAYITKGGQIFKSGVNDKELFFICELRDDTRIAERVAKQIEDGKLRSYSIAGSATKVQNMQKGVMPYMQVEDMELAEVTVCEKGVNQGAAFQILKAQTGKISKDQCGYRPATEVEIENGIMCGTCKFFNKEDKTCDTVDGVFEDTDYCKIFDAEEDQPEMEEGPKVKVRLILSDDNNIEFNKTLQELVQNPEWSTTSAGLQTQRDFWDWDLPLEKQIELGKHANTDRARVYPDPKHTMMDEADIERAKKPVLHRSTAKRIDEDIQRRLARSPETLNESATSIEIRRDREKDIKSYADKAAEMAAARRPKVDRRDPTTLPVVAEVREEMETLPNTIRRDNKGDGKMKKSLTDRLIDLYKAAGDISFTTPSKGRGAAGMGGGSVTPAMGNPELELASDSISPELMAQNEHRASESKKPMSEQRDQEGNLLSEKYGPGTKYSDGRISFLEDRIRRSDPDHSMYEPLSDEDKKLTAKTERRGDYLVDTSDTGHRGIPARLRGVHPETGEPMRQVGSSPPLNARGVPTETSHMTDRWTENAPDSPLEQKEKGRLYQENVTRQGVGPQGLGTNIEGRESQNAPFNPNTRTESMQRLLDAYKKKPMPKPTRMPEGAAREGMSPEQSRSMDIRASMDMEKGIGDIVRRLAGKGEKTPNYRSKEFAERRAEEHGGDVEEWMQKPVPESMKDKIAARADELGWKPSANPTTGKRSYSPSSEDDITEEKSIVKRFAKLYKANDDPMTTKESFTALTNEEARQQDHDQLLREYGFPSEVDPEANRYIPVVETETDDKGIPINHKGPWVVNEAGNDVGELLDEDAPSFSASEKAHNREGKKTASVSKSYREKPPVTPFLSKRSL